MLNLKIITAPDDQQRYNTVGDYFLDVDGKKTFVISDMKDWRYELLVAVHELIESALCKNREISDEMIDDFDFNFEKNRTEVNDDREPGDSLDAPYYKEHQFANKVEKMFAEELGVDWDKYVEVQRKLMRNKEVI